LSDLKVIATSWIIYGTTIVILKAFMSTRKEPFKLVTITALHNLFLCLISLAMFVSTLVEVFRRSEILGVDELFCTTDTDPDSERTKGRLFYTLYVYYLSKYYELFDTVILVLKKKPLIFLHWYHHAIVILMVSFYMRR
jgi:fatty acid elongase 3